MADSLFPAPVRSAMVNKDGTASQAWLSWFLVLYRRVGEAIAPSNRELGALYDDSTGVLATLAARITALEVPAGPVPLKAYTVAGLPAAVGYAGRMVYVSNESGGPVPAYSDGTNWRRVTDRAVVS